MPNLVKFTFIGIALIAGYFAQDIALWFGDDKKNQLAQYCPLSTLGCNQEAISVKLNHDLAQPLVPVQISAHWPNSQSHSLRLTLNGHEMDMGTALFELKANDEGIYQADVLLPVCTSGKMTWIGQLSDGHQSIDLAIRMAR